MVDIKLSQKNDKYTGANETVHVKKEDYDSLKSFDKVTYDIHYNTSYPSSSWLFWSKWPFYVYIKSLTMDNLIFTYCTNSAEHLVNKVEAFYSKDHPRIPLVIGFIRSNSTQYYKYVDLTKLKTSTGFPKNDYFLDSEIPNKLKEENSRRNKLTFKTDKRSENYQRDEERTKYKNYVQYKYSVHEDKFAGPYILSPNTLFEKEQSLVYESFFDIEGKSFDFIEIYYSDKDVALLVKFTDYSTENSSNTDTYFKRETRDGKKWKKISDTGTDFNTENLPATLDKVFYDINQSIMIYINKNTRDSSYPIKLVENIEDTPDSCKKQSLKISVKACSSLSDKNYQCFYNDLSQTTTGDISGLSNVIGLRLFIGSNTNESSNVDDSIKDDIEVKLYETALSKREIIYYKTASGPPQNKDKIYTYFYNDDNVPLLICYKNKWYKSISKEKYFDKWAEETELKGIEPGQSGLDSSIVSQLKKINRDLNAILLNNSAKYGLNIGEKKPKGFVETRVDVKIDNNQKYRKKTFETTNKGEIGKVMIGEEEILDCEKNKSFSQVYESEYSNKNYNQVTAYYHLSDSSNSSPLLICFGKKSSISDLFYERKISTDITKWRKIEDRNTSNLKEDSGLTNKINSIHYSFNKSLKLQLEKQGGQYQICLVNNNLTGTDPGSSISNEITVSKISDCLSDSNYICYEHTIPAFTGSTKEENIGGLRLFIYDREIPTHKNNGQSQKLPIFYNCNKKDVHVYFYSNKSVDTIPLLVGYNGNYYKPSSKNNYFNKWIQVQGITSPNTHLKAELDQINLDLNEINLSQTDDNSSYGISKPQESAELKSQFHTDRIKVNVCKSSYYRKICHTTTNEYSIGKVYYNGKLTGLKTNGAGNEIFIYYTYNDVNYVKPLLVQIKSSDSDKWYSRNDIDGIIWTNIEPIDSNEQIKHQLHTIGSKLFVPLTVKMEQHYDYTNDSHNTIAGDSDSSEVKVDRLYRDPGFRPESYRCCEHQLYNYYNNIKQSNPTLDLLINIAGNNIGLIYNNKMLPLYYKKSDSTLQSSIIVYFYENDCLGSSETDKVPLMFKFGNQFFIPIDKSNYFKKWNQINISLSSGNDLIKKNIKDKLDEINSILNEIDSSQKTDYGIPYCSDSYYYKKDGFSSKRVVVTEYSNSTHIMRVHDPVNKYKISKIKAISNQDFNEHKDKLKSHDIAQVAFIFTLKDLIYPKLVLLNQKTSFNNATFGYYYYDNKGEKELKYQFKEIEYGCDLMTSLTTTPEDDEHQCREYFEQIPEIFKQLTTDPMNRISNQHSEVETEICDQNVDSGITQCPGTEPPPLKGSELGPTSPIDPVGSQEAMGEGDSAVQLLLPAQEAIPKQVEHSESPPVLLPETSKQTITHSPQAEIPGGHISQSSDLHVTGSESLHHSTSTSELSLASNPDHRQNGDVTSGRTSPIAEIKESSPPDSLDSRESTSQKGVGSGLADRGTTVSSPESAENGDRYKNLGQDQERFRTSNREDQAVSSGTGFESASDTNHNQRREEQELSKVGVDSSNDSDSLGLENGNEFSSSGGMTSRNGKRKVVEEPVPNPDDNTTEDKGVGEKIVKFLDDHKEAVGGGGGALVTVSSSAYPLYKVISRLTIIETLPTLIRLKKLRY
ncbi:conserved hypothetical protein [Theileria orientalis strain Shintoku]|uniref:Uncharacterized protein n=1 Tax=Theileria orientalis strain Shintoku TaxID=869250 RepID=J4DPE3_THEOR|nr:conserved hypothetical protein [Theileria orientalis strain Shintoku]BAM40554.1 conserved hypothetical protein [Theileria orientalis strain Shintoku]|eukprot:XP_009690855.1 conserved hypothetical protein [Theileria orientalis strain Shintoku]